MPRYFFNVQDGTSRPDHEGTDLPDVAAARREAVRLAGALMTEEPQTFWSGEEWQMEVTDGTGLILFSFLFLATDAPSVGGQEWRVSL